MQSVERVRDLFLDLQLRMESSSEGSYRVQADSLALAELALGEPGEGGIRQLLASFFNAWRDLANAPEQSAARQAVVQTGTSLALASQRVARTFNTLRNDADDRVALLVDEMNVLGAEIAGLNEQIMTLRASGDAASDLSDRRDLALDRLAQIADIHYAEDQNGRVDVYIAGRALVSGTNSGQMYVDPNIANNNYFDVRWQTDNALAQFGSGEMQGLLIQRDTDLPARLADFNTLIAQLVTDINAVHAAGFAADGVTTATPFFAGTDARDTRGVAESQQLLLGRIENVRQSISGVNLDEELVQMVQFQRAYEAAAQIIRMIDEMLDHLINRTI